MYAVIDTETTGLSPADDRIIELAIIGVDADGNREWEWCSLINPQRDTGHGMAVRVHQIYASDVAGAPTFADFAGHVAHLLSGRALIAHNARFDLAMLTSEFRRVGHGIPGLVEICTASIARRMGLRPCRLDFCCEALGVEVEGAHHALADARATWGLARRLLDFRDGRLRGDVASRLREQAKWPRLPTLVNAPVQRPILPARKRAGRVGRNAERAREAVRAGEAGPVLETFAIDRESPEARYLAVVEWALEDREMSAEQQQALEALRCELGLTDAQVHGVHMSFIRGLAGSMWADGSLSDHEQYDLKLVGEVLQLSAQDVEYARNNPLGLDLINEDCVLQPGATVVFTGEMSIQRSEWVSRAKTAGLRVTGSVSGRTDYLVVPFGDTGSSKSRKARSLGVRVVSEQRFRRMIQRLERDA